MTQEDVNSRTASNATFDSNLDGSLMRSKDLNEGMQANGPTFGY